MLSFGMLWARAERIALRSRALPSGSPPPVLAAIVISPESLLKSAPRLASSAPLNRLTLDHLLCPDMEWEFCLKTNVVGQTRLSRNPIPERLEKNYYRGGERLLKSNSVSGFCQGFSQWCHAA